MSEMQKKTQLARGYGYEHKKLRRMLRDSVARGLALCAYCGDPIEPWEPWDLGHADDRRFWNGPEHVRCNRKSSTRRLRHSREW